jgi:hypothetical protein
MMEAIRMKKHHDLIFIFPFAQRLDSIWRPASSSPAIENTYPQSM